MTHGHKRKVCHNNYIKAADGTGCYGAENRDTHYDSTDRYPTDVLHYPSMQKEKRLHPTQKPVALLEYLVRTYTNPGDLVLDNCMGSCSTGIACIDTGRRFLGVELEDKYYNIAQERIREHKENMEGKTHE